MKSKSKNFYPDTSHSNSVVKQSDVASIKAEQSKRDQVKAEQPKAQQLKPASVPKPKMAASSKPMLKPVAKPNVQSMGSSPAKAIAKPAVQSIVKPVVKNIQKNIGVNMPRMHDCDCCRDELNLEKLCVKKVKACKICVKDLEVSDDFCASSLSSPEICAGMLMANRADINSSCMTDLNVSNQCVQNLTATNAGIVNLVANDVCISGSLQAANFVACSKFEATAVYSTITTYTLGNLLSFDNILSNASGALSVSPTTYTAPVAGNYIVMFQIDQQNMVPNPSFGPILGVPVANPQIILNGVIHRELYSSYLTFFNQQRSTMTALVTMNAGDLLQFKYKVLAVQQSTGVTEIVGTVDILGNGSADDQSIVKIELLSANCDSGSMSCAPVVPCVPCVPQQCVPCVPGEPDNDMDCMSGGCVRRGR